MDEPDYSSYIPDFIQLYIFDLDGTLVDSLSDLTNTINAMLNRYALPPVDKDVVKICVGTGAYNLLFRTFALSAQAAGSKCPTSISSTGILADSNPLTANERNTDYPQFSALITEVLSIYSDVYWDNCTNTVELYPGIQKWLEDLFTRGCKMAVLSNKSNKASIKILTSLNALHFFEIIAGPETTGVLKPDPSGIHHIIAQTGIPKENTIMIGDSMVDIITGRNAGVQVCGLTGGFGDDTLLRNAFCDVLIERP